MIPINVTELELSVTGAPISIVFPQVELPIDRTSKIECVVFRNNGSVNYLSTSYSMSMCIAMSSGRFSIVVSPSSLRPPLVVMREEQGRKWRNWVIVSMIGVVRLALLCLLVGIGFYKKITKSGKLKEMEIKAENGEVSESVCIPQYEHLNLTLRMKLHHEHTVNITLFLKCLIFIFTICLIGFKERRNCYFIISFSS